MKATELIKQEDLRLNNYVSFLGAIGTVRTIGNTCAFKTKTTTKRVCAEDFEPIELTEELLLRANFKQLDKYTFRKDGLFIYHRKRGFVSGSAKREVKLDYFHDVQNWYYTNSNKKELTLN